MASSRPPRSRRPRWWPPALHARRGFESQTACPTPMVRDSRCNRAVQVLSAGLAGQPDDGPRPERTETPTRPEIVRGPAGLVTRVPVDAIHEAPGLDSPGFTAPRVMPPAS